jgi:Ca2+-binding RTX toxin-like protein
MFYYNDLRTILGQQYDFGTNDFITASGTADTINIYGGNDYVEALGGDDVIFDVRSYNGGNSGNDAVIAGEGNDLIVSSLDSTNFYSGGIGNDTLNVIPNSNGVYIDLDLGIARDRSTLATSELVSIENAVGSAWNDYLYGDAQANRLTGYNGDDLIRGQAGNDTLDGGRGQDVLFGGTGNDLAYGEDGGDILYGDAGNDFLNGGLGDDFLTGGTGLDHMVGGAGFDDFVFKSLSDSVNGVNADQILDFQHLVDDMDVSAIDANALRTSNQAFRFIGDHAFNRAGQISAHWDAARNETVLKFNTDNDAAAEMTIKLDGHINVTALDFIL